MTEVIYQSNHHFVVGHGPHACGAAGCVLCASVMALHEFGQTDITPESFNANALADKAFDDPGTEGDELDIALAMERYGVTVDERKYEGCGYELAMIYAYGGRALVRVAFTDRPGASDHTILGIGADPKTGEIICLDPAIGHVRLTAQLTATDLGWGKDSNGKQILQNYRVVNVRGLHKGK